MSRLHWHLSDDQGSRIEIDGYPELTEIGAWRAGADGGRYGGFYGREQIREIVEYAAERHIQIVPEVDVPGHTSAALAACPELGCRRQRMPVPTDWGIFRGILCAGRERTYEFLEAVFGQIAELFPFEQIHVGGDEVPKQRWEQCPDCQERVRAHGLGDTRGLETYLFARLHEILARHGRRMIAWDDVLVDSAPPSDAVIQFWRYDRLIGGVSPLVHAVRGGHDVIASPADACYLDYSHERTPLSAAYEWDPVPPPDVVSPATARHVLGVEGPLWSERIPTQHRLDEQAFPRAAALAEVGWTPRPRRDWDTFARRLGTHLRRLDRLGVRYHRDG
jgi:hexosaminidase